MPGPRAKLRDLALLARDDADALRDALRADAGCLGVALGVPEQELRALAEDEQGGTRGVLRILDHVRRQAIDRQALEREQRALTAAHQLVVTAHWLDVGVELDPRVLLGDLLADRGKPWIGLLVDGAHVIVSRARLRRAALALRPFADQSAFVDTQALRLRWRGGLGGLNFSSQAGHVRGESQVLRVVLERPKAQPVESLHRPRPLCPSNTWLADVVSELVGRASRTRAAAAPRPPTPLPRGNP